MAKRTWWWGSSSFLAEIGIEPVLCASGGTSGRLETAVAEVTGDLLPEAPVVREGMDFYEIAEEAEALAPDLLIGHSKGYHLAKTLAGPPGAGGFSHSRPLRRPKDSAPGLPGRPESAGPIVNAVLERKQETRPVGYGYM